MKLLLGFILIGFSFTFIDFSTSISIHNEVLLADLDADSTIFQNKTYYIITTVQGNWYLYYEFCRQIGLRLLTISSKEENDFIEAYLQRNGLNETNGYFFWTAGNCLGDQDKYVWMSTGQPISYFKWSEDPKPDKEKRCVYGVYGKETYEFSWTLDKCDEKEMYGICEIPDECIPKDNQ